MIMYDKGLPSLPDDIIYEIFTLLDTRALKSCSLTGKALSHSTKPFLHRILSLTPRYWGPAKSNIPGYWNELEGLPTLGERGLLKYTRHILVFLPYCTLLSAHMLQPHIRHLHALTNLRSLEVRWLDAPSFMPRMEKYFGAFLESLESLELVFPRGDHKQILFFICQFRNLRDLTINTVQGYSHSRHDGGPHFDIELSPPLDGILDLRLDADTGPEIDLMSAQSILCSLATLSSGLKFRTLKLSKPRHGLQVLVDACAPTLECMEFTGVWAGV